MVGFGSSLRMARRPGWEHAYLDYESLKLLLSQIEAVYEEEGHRQRTKTSFGSHGRSTSSNQMHIADYRDELFNESNSDLAYASSDNEIDQVVSSEDEGSPYQGLKPFLTYSHEPSSSEAEDSVDMDSTCGGGTIGRIGWLREQDSRKRHRKKHRRIEPRQEENEFLFNHGPSTFLVEAQDDGYGTSTPAHFMERNMEDGSLVLPPLVDQHSSTESTSLLPNVSWTGTSLVQSDPVSPLHKSFVGNKNWVAPRNDNDTVDAQRGQETISERHRQRKDAKKRRRQRQKKRRQLLRKKAKRDKRVPPHLRVAHAKARAITERFLGLLKAEVEKVTLFTQSRLGELADTAGSLRFPSDDGSEYHRGSIRSRKNMHGHPLSDGGMHPSASSSEDEGDGMVGTFPWSDTSDEEASNNKGDSREDSSFSSPMRKSYSGSTIRTEHRSNVSADNPPAIGSRRRNSKPYSASVNARRRQIDHFSDLRKSRPIFQRIDHIVGDDLLLLSAVDEADGYTAVGVELMHVLKFVSVNVIAVRKICRKHDKLLMNRMLGGYYHRKWKKSKPVEAPNKSVNAITLGRIVSRSLGDGTNGVPFFVTGVNRNKLVGFYDRKIQNLANSSTVQVISSCIALALSEYEVSHSRADALANLNGNQISPKTPRKNSGRNIFEDVLPGLSPFGTTQNPLAPMGGILGASDNFDTAHSIDSHDLSENGPPSTVSTISLTRLRFAVVSTFALREVARQKLDNFKAFMARSSLVFTGTNVIGEGLDGCSREILDFFVAYNPDSALLLDGSGLYNGLQKGRWRQRPIGSVMLSTLAMGVSSHSTQSGSSFPERSQDVIDAVTVMPISGDLSYLDGYRVNRPHIISDIPDQKGKFINRVTLTLNRTAALLYCVSFSAVVQRRTKGLTPFVLR